MEKRTQHKIIYTIIILLSLLFPINSVAKQDKITVPIVEKSAVVYTLSYEQLRSIFTLSTLRWNDGKKIKVILLPEDSMIQRQFIWEYFGLTPTRYNEIIYSKIDTGRSTQHVFATDQQDMLRKVESIEGSIGFSDVLILVREGNEVRSIKIK